MQLEMMIKWAKSRRSVTGLHYAVVQRGDFGERLQVVEHRRHKNHNAITGVVWSTKNEAEKNAYLTGQLSE